MSFNNTVYLSNTLLLIAPAFFISQLAKGLIRLLAAKTLETIPVGAVKVKEPLFEFALIDPYV